MRPPLLSLQDEIKRLLLQRHTMEAAIRARLAQRAQAPGQAAKARQLAAQLAQIVVDMPHLPGMGPEQAPAGTNAPNGVVSPLGDPGRHDADGHAAFPSAGRRSGGPGGRGAESGAESDVEVMDAPSAATEWAKKREAGLKRRREGQSEDAGAKRVRGPEVSEQGGETGREGHLEWRMRKEGEKKMDHLGAGQVGKGTPFRIVIKEEVNGLASRSAAPSDGGATPLVVARALGRPPGSSGGPGVHSAATGEAIPVEQRRSGVEAAAAPSSWLRPALVATAEERVTSVDTSEAAVTQVGAVAEVEQQRIVSGDENLVGRAPNVVQAKQRAPREENCSGDGPLEVRGQQLVRVPGEIPTGGTGVAIHAPASGAAKAHAADTTGAATEGAAQAGRGRGDSTSEQTAAATAGTKVVGLGFKRKRHGAAPKPKRKEVSDRWLRQLV